MCASSVGLSIHSIEVFCGIPSTRCYALTIYSLYKYQRRFIERVNGKGNGLHCNKLLARCGAPLIDKLRVYNVMRDTVVNRNRMNDSIESTGTSLTFSNKGTGLLWAIKRELPRFWTWLRLLRHDEANVLRAIFPWTPDH